MSRQISFVGGIDAREARPGGQGFPAPLQDNRSVLVVDDDASECLRIAIILEKAGFSVTRAADGTEALSMIVLGYRPDIIVSDWLMPELDGLQLCRKVRQSAGVYSAYFILVTGRDGTSLVEEGLNAGADDFIAKPYRAEELRARVEAGRRIVAERAALQSRNSALRELLENKRAAGARLRSGLAAAASLQRRQLPPRLGVIEDIECGRVFESADTLAGDGFGCLPLRSGQLAFYIFDVAGHGVSAALNSFAVGRALGSPGALRSLLMKGATVRPPSEVVRRLNDQFLGDENCDQYFTMVYGTLDTRSGAGTLCQAGHPHPLICGSGGDARLLGDGGHPVGLLEDAQFSDTRFRLEPGERLVLVSDGILECGESSDPASGSERLFRLVTSVCGVPLEQALAQIETTLGLWRSPGGFEDDVSLMILGRPARPDAS